MFRLLLQLTLVWQKGGHLLGNATPLASAAVPAPGGAVQAAEGEVGWLTILVIVILVAEYHGCSIMSNRDTSHVP